MTPLRQPCIWCGEDTSAGSPLFSDRLVGQQGGETRYLCSLCAQRMKGTREVREMTEEQRKKLENAAFVFGSFAPGPH